MPDRANRRGKSLSGSRDFYIHDVDSHEVDGHDIGGDRGAAGGRPERISADSFGVGNHFAGNADGVNTLVDKDPLEPMA